MFCFYNISFTINAKEGDMKLKHFLAGFMVLFFGFAMSGCAGLSSRTSADITCMTQDVDAMTKSGEYRKKVDNFLILFDASSSMNEKLGGLFSQEPTKQLLAKDLVSCINSSLPDDFDVQAGMRAFGPAKYETNLLYGMSKFSRSDLQNAVDGVNTSIWDGLTPIGDAISFASDDLQGARGKTAVILFSDGFNTDKPDPVAAATAMKERYGENICIYTVLLGDNTKGRMTMEQIAEAGQCGFATEADKLHSRTLSDGLSTVGNAEGMADFVTAVFLEKAPKKAPPKKVDLDSDGDGVLDSVDKCPNTPKGMKVDKDGCPVPIPEKVSITLLVEFDFDKAKVKPQFHDEIARVAAFLQAYPKTTGVLEGHTDSIGSEQYNQRLSERRAESVKKYLVEKFNIDGARLTTVGYGETKPVATNATDAGRRRNRRVVANIVTIVIK